MNDDTRKGRPPLPDRRTGGETDDSAQDAPDIEAFLRLTAAAEPHLKAAIAHAVPEEMREMAEAEYAQYGDVWLHGAMIAWTVELARLAYASGGDVSLASLDEAMLPHGTTDDDLLGGAGGIIDGEAIRDALKRFKASLPAGRALPDELVELLREDGATVVP